MPRTLNALALLAFTGSTLLFVTTIWRTLFVMSHLGDALRFGGGSISLNWASERKIAELTANGYSRQRTWSFHDGPRKFPIEWWPPASIYENPGFGSVTVRLWFIMLCSGALSVQALRRKSHAPPLCPKCGYDLAGNYSLPCPECGHTATNR